MVKKTREYRQLCELVGKEFLVAKEDGTEEFVGYVVQVGRDCYLASRIDDDFGWYARGTGLWDIENEYFVRMGTHFVRESTSLYEKFDEAIPR